MTDNVDCLALEELWEDLVSEWLSEDLESVNTLKVDASTSEYFKQNLQFLVQYNLLKDIRSILTDPQTARALQTARLAYKQQRLLESHGGAQGPSSVAEHKRAVAQARQQHVARLQKAIQDAEGEGRLLAAKEQELQAEATALQAPALEQLKRLQEFSSSNELPIEELNTLRASLLRFVYSG